VYPMQIQMFLNVPLGIHQIYHRFHYKAILGAEVRAFFHLAMTAQKIPKKKQYITLTSQQKWISISRVGYLMLVHAKLH
jgi:hypothetical protein